MDQTRKSFENDPVLFVAICSGHPKANIASYAKGVKTDWPTYADTDRAFETAVLKQVISLQNIHQTLLMTTSGDTHPIDSEKLADAVKAELDGAKWNMDPKEIPAPLKKAWLSLEFGQTSAAIVTIKQALAAADAKVKEAAQKLDAVVKEDVAKRFADAQAKVTAGAKWDGYKIYDFIANNYKPYPEVAKSQTEIGKLKADAKIQKELRAKGMLDKVQELAASPRKPDHELAKQGAAMLQKDFADTEAGEASKSVKLPEDKKPGDKPAG